MKKTKKIMLALALVFGFCSFGISQLNGEQQRAKNLARQAASDCINHQELAGAQLNYVLTETSICDFLSGPTGAAAIFGYQVDIYAEGHCPGNIRELCDPYYRKVATVFVSCGNAEAYEVICY